ncbi:MAG: methylmalonyl-CoA epimerase [Proteobacteria bacterium]|nr:methylmalonyl-CoA epimerase [Pseudomonadota bacterium]
MTVRKVSHIGIAVERLAAQVPFYRDELGLPLIAEEEVADQGVRVAIFQAGDTRIELLEPTRPDSPIARFLERRGPGLHHLAYQVDEVGSVLQRLQEHGCRLIDEAPRAGAHGARIAFVHPKSTGGVLTELCEEHAIPLDSSATCVTTPSDRS